MEEKIAGGVRVYGTETDDYPRCVINEIDFKFDNKYCVLSIRVNNLPSKKFKIKYEESNFQVSLEKDLKALGLGLLDYTSINNLYQIKLVDQLLVKALKEGMQMINILSANSIYEPGQSIQALVNNANVEATAIVKKIEEKFSKIFSVIEEVQMEVYDRTPLIKKAKEELLDNLNRKYVLIVNQLIEKERGHEIPESSLSAQVEELINNL
jgi:hypothetical protein